jgi:integrase
MRITNENTTELSNLKCQKAVPGSKPYRISDHGGLFLLVMPEGGKLWRWKYRFEGRERLMALGKYPDVTLANVRVLHAKARLQLAAGTDPMAVRKEAKTKKSVVRMEESAAKFTFEDLALKWFAKWSSGKHPRHVLNVERRLENDLIAVIGNKSPAEVTPMDLVELTKAVDERGARDLAKRNLQFVRRIYKWGKSNNYLGKDVVNPATDIDVADVLSNHTPKKFAHLKISEVPELLRKMRNYDGNGLTRLAMELLSLTFVRTSELITARWEEIDLENRIWRVPKEHMKMKQPHLIPLSTQVVALLKRLHEISGSTERLFPDCKGGLGTMSHATILHALWQMGYKGRMTGHGWRHIASTYLRGKGYNKFYVEAQLAHAEPGVAGVYNEADYLDYRTEMMQHWADFLDECREKPATLSIAA